MVTDKELDAALDAAAKEFIRQSIPKLTDKFTHGVDIDAPVYFWTVPASGLRVCHEGGILKADEYVIPMRKVKE